MKLGCNRKALFSVRTVFKNPAAFLFAVVRHARLLANCRQFADGPAPPRNGRIGCPPSVLPLAYWFFSGTIKGGKELTENGRSRVRDRSVTLQSLGTLSSQTRRRPRLQTPERP